MQFSPDLRPGVADGTVTVSIRLWKHARVKVGGRYSNADVVIEVTDLDVIPFSAVTDDDVARSGEPDRETLRERAAHAGPIEDSTLVHRVEFHVVD